MRISGENRKGDGIGESRESGADDDLEDDTDATAYDVNALDDRINVNDYERMTENAETFKFHVISFPPLRLSIEKIVNIFLLIFVLSPFSDTLL